MVESKELKPRRQFSYTLCSSPPWTPPRVHHGPKSRAQIQRETSLNETRARIRPGQFRYVFYFVQGGVSNLELAAGTDPSTHDAIQGEVSGRPSRETTLLTLSFRFLSMKERYEVVTAVRRARRPNEVLLSILLNHLAYRLMTSTNANSSSRTRN